MTPTTWPETDKKDTLLVQGLASRFANYEKRTIFLEANKDASLSSNGVNSSRSRGRSTRDGQSIEDFHLERSDNRGGWAGQKWTRLNRAGGLRSICPALEAGARRPRERERVKFESAAGSGAEIKKKKKRVRGRKTRGRGSERVLRRTRGGSRLCSTTLLIYVALREGVARRGESARHTQSCLI